MKKLISSAALIFLATSSLSLASDYMTGDQRQTAFCGKTFDGKNEFSGSTFKIHLDQECKTNTIHYLTGKKAGKTFERKINNIYANGELCRSSKNGKESCNKVKDMGNGTYEVTGTNGKWKGKHYVTLSNIVDGNQL